MAERRTTKEQDSNRPQAIRTSYSFPRIESEALSPRKRASTLQEQGIPAVPTARNIATSPELVGKRHVADVFENHEEEHHAPSPSGTGPELNLPSTFDELPIEIRSLTERFLDSLSAKVHPTPLTSDALSDLFQDFYERAAASISTHIANLSSRIGREKSPTPSNSSKSSGRARAGSGAKRSESSPSYSSGGEMLTASEVADRRKARRLLEAKRLALEEAVERAVCEKVYERIYKHRSTDDDARDEKLRSRTAALALVGIGLKELHVESPTNQDVRKATEEREEEIHLSLAPAREALQRMDEEQYPLGKLKHLTDTHKSIVETLSQLFPSSSSADEILPTLIYTLITSPPEYLNVVSNLNFIQRFRSSSKVDGEAAYCLVNLEAAISFLETVDLSSLRADELPEGPGKSSPGSRTPTSDRPSLLTPTKASPAQPLKPGLSAVTVESTEKSSSPTEASRSLPSSPRRTSAPATTNIAHAAQQQQQQRRISAIVQAQADRIEAGRDNILNTADKIYESINGTLENSFQFVFGRFKEHVSGDSPLPKTLEDARKLVSSPHPAEAGEDEMGSGRSSPSPSFDDPLNDNSAGPRTADSNNKRMLELIGGQRPPVRDRSVDSARSAGSLGSGKRVAFEKVAMKEDATPAAGGNLFANINPLNRFGVNVPGFARFGRTGSNPTIPPSTPAPGQGKLGNIVESPTNARDGEIFEKQRSRSRESNSGNEEMNAREVLAELRKLKPPKKRFLEVQSAAELRLGEVEELLREYRRLAKGIGEAVAL
ncbi:hypothetical protein LTR37_001184 [Vermiconidia calcicola]|uniref:Uncharacterized protein n=1 Tax=Vermiconidia calcicola TaxID=1690605 RepID=A0ACC3NVQ3_9PEZI|nr:hypothetical protein LTR37_001184 [Vermiconidia calcicola]